MNEAIQYTVKIVLTCNNFLQPTAVTLRKVQIYNPHLSSICCNQNTSSQMVLLSTLHSATDP